MGLFCPFGQNIRPNFANIEQADWISIAKKDVERSNEDNDCMLQILSGCEFYVTRIREALSVGAWMHAWRVVLTHFSQRYPKLADVRSDVRCDISRRAIVAFDLMTLPLRLLPALPALTPALLCVFAEELDDEPASLPLTSIN